MILNIQMREDRRKKEERVKEGKRENEQKGSDMGSEKKSVT